MTLDFEAFYIRNIYHRGRDCFNRPIASTPGAHFDIVDRVSDDNNWTYRFVCSDEQKWYMTSAAKPLSRAMLLC